MVKLNFGEWLPDLPEDENPGALLARNCIPRIRSYGEFRSLTTFSDALDGPARGVFWARSAGGTIYVFAGDQTKLYRLVGNNWNDVSQASVTYSANLWDFVLFGNRVIATDNSTALQYFDLDTGSTFLDLPGTPPRAKVIGSVRDFVVLGDITVGADVIDNGVAWSGFNNSELWTPSIRTQSDFQPLRGNGGQVQRIVPGAVGVIFQERSIQTMTYVGPSTIFRFDEIKVDHGTPAGRSVAWTKDFIFYYSQDGFYRMDRRNYQTEPIGVNKINRWFMNEAAASEIVNMKAAVDRSRHLVFWTFKSTTSSAEDNRMLIYDWANDRWSYAELALQFVGDYATIGANLDTLDTVLGPGGIDINSIPVDSEAYAGGAVSLIGFNGSNQAGTFDGPALVAEIDTTEFSQDDQLLYSDGARPIIGGSNSTVEVAPITRDLKQGTPVVGTFGGVNAIGKVDFRENARYHRYRVRITGGFSDAQRLEMDFSVKGKR